MRGGGELTRASWLRKSVWFVATTSVICKSCLCWKNKNTWTVKVFLICSQIFLMSHLHLYAFAWLTLQIGSKHDCGGRIWPSFCLVLGFLNAQPCLEYFWSTNICWWPKERLQCRIWESHNCYHHHRHHLWTPSSRLLAVSHLGPMCWCKERERSRCGKGGREGGVAVG